MKMKSDRPLLIDGVPSTEFETTEHHGRELIKAGLAAEVGGGAGKSADSSAETSSAAEPSAKPAAKPKK